MILADILSWLLRLGELVFSIIVAGLTGSWLRAHRHGPASSYKRFIYTEVIAALAILFSLFFLLPFTRSFIHWPIDLLMFIATMIAFGLLAHYAGNTCGNLWNQNYPTRGRGCGRFNTNISFLFLTSIFFLASALLGLYYKHKQRRNTELDRKAGQGQKRWYRNRQ